MSERFTIPPHPKILECQGIDIATAFVGDDDLVVVASRHMSAIVLYLEICVIGSGHIMVQFGRKDDPDRRPVRNVVVDDQTGVPEWFYSL